MTQISSHIATRIGASAPRDDGKEGTGQKSPTTTKKKIVGSRDKGSSNGGSKNRGIRIEVRMEEQAFKDPNYVVQTEEAWIEGSRTKGVRAEKAIQVEDEKNDE
ncbi:hypothetical protein HAX54_025309 [Datura stramonium]|uniref:Uncharacterized protein n=1 Tax=Datura stramonium TaxID=4076 RepID=A0ABS8V1A0_DATST|nr:hypothetical protein [Datura stramonium]